MSLLEKILRLPLSLSTHFVNKTTFLYEIMAVLEIQLLMRYFIYNVKTGNSIIFLHLSSQKLRYMYIHTVGHMSYSVGLL